MPRPPEMYRTHPTYLFVLAMGLASLLTLESAVGLQQTKKTQIKSQPAAPSHAAPDVTATIPDHAPSKPADEEALPPPFYLPAAPRARIRSCGQKWEGIKMGGEAGNQTWRDFATRCLTEPDQPAKPTR